MLGATRPFGQIFDLTLVPPHEKSLISLLKYALRLVVSSESWERDTLFEVRGKDIIARMHPIIYIVLSMSQTQTRKQKILGDVKRKRRQRAVTTLVVVIALIAIVVVAVFLIPRSSNPVQLPQYLSTCVNVGYFYHSHPNLTVIINGVGISLPVTYNSGCPQPIHTHDSTGVLHLEPGENRDYHLSDWFLLWGYNNGNTNYTIFNKNQIFTNKVDTTHQLTMTVNGLSSMDFENHVFPRNAAPTGGVAGQGLCAIQTGQCVKDNIVIIYG